MLQYSLTLALLLACGGSAQSPPPYPDIVSSISLHPGSVPVLPDLDFTTWIVEDGASLSTFEADGLKYELISQGFAADGPVGSMTGGVFDEVYTTPVSSLGERMVGAGITTVEAQGPLKLTVSGLPDGQYQFTSFFNSWTTDEVAASVLLTFNRQMHDIVRTYVLTLLYLLTTLQDLRANYPTEGLERSIPHIDPCQCRWRVPRSRLRSICSWQHLLHRLRDQWCSPVGLDCVSFTSKSRNRRGCTGRRTCGFLGS